MRWRQSPWAAKKALADGAASFTASLNMALSVANGTVYHAGSDVFAESLVLSDLAPNLDGGSDESFTEGYVQSQGNLPNTTANSHGQSAGLVMNGAGSVSATLPPGSVAGGVAGVTGDEFFALCGLTSGCYQLTLTPDSLSGISWSFTSGATSGGDVIGDVSYSVGYYDSRGCEVDLCGDSGERGQDLFRGVQLLGFVGRVFGSENLLRSV